MLTPTPWQTTKPNLFGKTLEVGRRRDRVGHWQGEGGGEVGTHGQVEGGARRVKEDAVKAAGWPTPERQRRIQAYALHGRLDAEPRRKLLHLCEPPC